MPLYKYRSAKLNTLCELELNLQLQSHLHNCNIHHIRLPQKFVSIGIPENARRLAHAK